MVPIASYLYCPRHLFLQVLLEIFLATFEQLLFKLYLLLIDYLYFITQVIFPPHISILIKGEFLLSCPPHRLSVSICSWCEGVDKESEKIESNSGKKSIIASLLPVFLYNLAIFLSLF